MFKHHGDRCRDHGDRRPRYYSYFDDDGFEPKRRGRIRHVRLEPYDRRSHRIDWLDDAGEMDVDFR